MELRADERPGIRGDVAARDGGGRSSTTLLSACLFEVKNDSGVAGVSAFDRLSLLMAGGGSSWDAAPPDSLWEKFAGLCTGDDVELRAIGCQEELGGLLAEGWTDPSRFGREPGSRRVMVDSRGEPTKALSQGEVPAVKNSPAMSLLESGGEPVSKLQSMCGLPWRLFGRGRGTDLGSGLK